MVWGVVIFFVALCPNHAGSYDGRRRLVDIGKSPILQKRWQLKNRNLSRPCLKIEEPKHGSGFNDWWTVDARRLEYNKDVADSLLQYDYSHLIYEVLPVKEKSFVFATAIDKRATPKSWDYTERLQLSWSYAKTHGYGAYYCIVEELTAEFLELMDQITFNWEIEIWEQLCTFLVALNNPDVAWTYFHDQDSFINPKYFELKLDYYIPKAINSEYVVAVSDDMVLELGVYFIRNNPAGIAFMLAFLLEMQLNIWLTHKMILSRKFAFRSVVMDYLDLGLNIPVHHRLRSLIGTILRGAVSCHFYNWNDQSKWLFEQEYGFTWRELSSSNEKTKPIYYIFSPTRKESAAITNSRIAFAHRNGKYQSMFIADPDGRKGKLNEWMETWLISDFPDSCFGIGGNPCMRWNFTEHIEAAFKNSLKMRILRGRNTDIKDFGQRRKT